METEKLPRKPIADVTITDIDSYLGSEGKALGRELVLMPYSEVMEQIYRYKEIYERPALEAKLKKKDNYFRRLVRTKQFIELKYKKQEDGDGGQDD